MTFLHSVLYFGYQSRILQRSFLSLMSLVSTTVSLHFRFFVRDCYFWAFSWLFDFVSVFDHQLSDGLVSLSPRLGQFCPLGRLGPLQQLLLHSQTGLVLLHLQLYARLLRQMHVFFWFVIIRGMLVEFTSKLPLYHHLQNSRNCSLGKEKELANNRAALRMEGFFFKPHFMLLQTVMISFSKKKSAPAGAGPLFLRSETDVG